jgi:sugar phosphate isomerase/epimerase
MKLSFMSPLLPQRTVPELIRVAQEHGYDGIEFRAQCKQAHGVDLDATPEHIRTVREAMSDAGLEISCLSISQSFGTRDDVDYEAELDILKHYLDLSATLGGPCVRIFGDPLSNTGSAKRAKEYLRLVEYCSRGAAFAEKAGVKIALETHSNFRAVDAGEVMFLSGYPKALWINWHLEHCLNHGEDVDEAYRYVKGRVVHCHFGFSTGDKGEKSLVAHIERQAELLMTEGFAGHFSVEYWPGDDAAGLKLISDHAKEWKAMRQRLGF